MSTEGYWAVAQTVSKMEHIVRREIEKTNHGTFLPTYTRHWKVDGRDYVKECPRIGGYVFFKTSGDDYAGIPDIHGVYNVLSNPDGSAKRVQSAEMVRLMLRHACGNSEALPPRYTKYHRPETSRRKSRKPRASKRIRNLHTP